MYHLPPEILVQIFRTSTYERIDIPIGAENPSQPHAVLSLSHVCRTWRSIMLGYPSLWDVIHTGCSLKLVSACLDRSHSIPLRVRVEVPASDAKPWFLDLIPGFTHRLQQLYIRRVDDCENETVSVQRIMSFLNSPAPKLENLTIDVRLPDSLLMPTLFSASTPSLKVLSLNRLRWNKQNQFGGLTRLKLTGVKGFACAQLHEALLQSPELEQLELSAIIPQCPDLNRNFRIPLPRLCHLEVRNVRWPTLRTFLSLLDIPSKCNIVCLYLDPPPGTTNCVLSAFLPADLSLIRPLNQSTKLAIGLPNALVLCGGNEESAFELSSGWPVMESSGCFFEHTLLSLVHDFPVDAVQELWLGPLPPRPASTRPTVETWRAVIQSMPRLRTLVLLPGIHVPDLLNCFCSENSADPPFLRDLTHLRIVYNRFGSLLPWNSLEAFVEGRRGLGLPLRSFWVQDLFSRMSRPQGCMGGILRYENDRYTSSNGPTFRLPGWEFARYNRSLEQEAAY